MQAMATIASRSHSQPTLRVRRLAPNTLFYGFLLLIAGIPVFVWVRWRAMPGTVIAGAEPVPIEQTASANPAGRTTSG